MNLKEIAYSHYLPAKRKRRRANTCEGYASALRLHVIPRFGAMELEAITHEAIQEWVDSFELPGAAAKAFKTLRQVIRWSIANLGIRIWDPTIGIELPRKPKPEKHVLNAEEVATTLRGFWGHELEPAVILSSVLGLRPGETYGMRWSDIDMRSGAVHVRRTLQEVRGLMHVYLPKTEKSERTVYLPRFALDRLRAIWREQSRPKGRVIGEFKPSQVARRIKAWCRRQALPYVSMYQRRHTWATIAVEAGAGIEAVAMMLGHGSINTTQQYYLQPTRKICAGLKPSGIVAICIEFHAGISLLRVIGSLTHRDTMPLVFTPYILSCDEMFTIDAANEAGDTESQVRHDAVAMNRFRPVLGFRLEVNAKRAIGHMEPHQVVAVRAIRPHHADQAAKGER